MTEAEYRIAFTAMAQVESETLNPMEYNEKENAKGIVQIRTLYLKDANEYLGTSYSHNDCYSMSVSFELFKGYMKRYKARNIEECARLHVGGPSWRNKPTATGVYWKKVNRKL